MITIDGTQGEGGGQVLRSSLALSLITEQPITIENIRARRRKPGLRHQHRAAVEAAQAISNAQLQGAQVGSTRLVFRPGKVKPGKYDFDVGTAGSTTLVLQTILPALMLAEGASEVQFEGGTHNPLAPPYDFVTKAYLPLLRRMGAVVEAGPCTAGYYPAGGGSFQVRVQPCARLESLELLERGPLVRRRVRAVVANLPAHIAERECRWIGKKTGWEESCFVRETDTASRGPGNVVMIELEHAHVTEVFSAFGELGKKAERVAAEALEQAQEYLDAEVPVGHYLADQLLLPMGVAAHFGRSGSFRTLPLSGHAETHIKILKHFLEIDVDVSLQDQNVLVRIAPGRFAPGR